MKNTCQSCCERDGELVRELAHVKKGATHYLCMDKAEGLVPAMFEAVADYVAGDSFVLNCEEYNVVPQDGNELKAGFFRKGALVSVLVDTEGKCLGFTSGNGVKRLPDSAEGHLLVGGPDGEPADSGKTVEDFDPAGSAQAVQSGLDEHKADAVAHVTEAERVGWDNKADRAPDAVAGHLAALDALGNPVDSGLSPETIGAVTSIFGRAGEVTAQAGDYTAAMVGAADRGEGGAALNALKLGGVPAVNYPTTKSGTWQPKIVSWDGLREAPLTSGSMGIWRKIGNVMYIYADIQFLHKGTLESDDFFRIVGLPEAAFPISQGGPTVFAQNTNVETMLSLQIAGSYINVFKAAIPITRLYVRDVADNFSIYSFSTSYLVSD